MRSRTAQQWSAVGLALPVLAVLMPAQNLWYYW